MYSGSWVEIAAVAWSPSCGPSCSRCHCCRHHSVDAVGAAVVAVAGGGGGDSASAAAGHGPSCRSHRTPLGYTVGSLMMSRLPYFRGYLIACTEMVEEKKQGGKLVEENFSRWEESPTNTDSTNFFFFVFDRVDLWNFRGCYPFQELIFKYIIYKPYVLLTSFWTCLFDCFPPRFGFFGAVVPSLFFLRTFFVFGNLLSFFHFIRRFWNHILICRSDRVSVWAISMRRRRVRYLLKWNSFSSSRIWWRV